MQNGSRTDSRPVRPSRRGGWALSGGLLLLALVACTSPDRPRDPRRDPGPELDPQQRGAAITLARSPRFDEIAELEDRRSLGDGRLFELAADGNSELRARAVTALGRLPFPDFGAEVTNALCRALEDEIVEVRVAAAFALGVRADPASGGNLLANRNDPDPRIRARVVEAASRLADPTVHGALLTALRDTEITVQIEAVVGTARWSREESGAEQVDRALLDALHPYRLSTNPQVEAPSRSGPELTWRILFALARRGSPGGRGAFLEYASSSRPLERLFAVRGLGRIDPDPENVKLLARILEAEVKSREDWRVAYEAAVALGKHADPAGRSALVAAVEHESTHVRAAALDGLGEYPDARSEILRR